MLESSRVVKEAIVVGSPPRPPVDLKGERGFRTSERHSNTPSDSYSLSSGEGWGGEPTTSNISLSLYKSDGPGWEWENVQ